MSRIHAFCCYLSSSQTDDGDPISSVHRTIFTFPWKMLLAVAGEDDLL